MIYRIKLRSKRTNTTTWFNVKANDQKEAIREMMIMLIRTNTGDTFEIRKVKKVIKIYGMEKAIKQTDATSYMVD